jgi:predicted DNA-binding transcriptional regulator AlpA
MARKIISPSELPERGIKIGDKQRQRLEATGLFPKRVAVTARTCGYVEDEIQAFIEARINQRDTATVAA